MARRGRVGSPGFNALAGIFAFRTHTALTCSSSLNGCFNALAGIFAFRTGIPVSDIISSLRFNALAGIFAFRTLVK